MACRSDCVCCRLPSINSSVSGQCLFCGKTWRDADHPLPSSSSLSAHTQPPHTNIFGRQRFHTSNPPNFKAYKLQPSSPPITPPPLPPKLQPFRQFKPSKTSPLLVPELQTPCSSPNILTFSSSSFSNLKPLNYNLLPSSSTHNSSAPSPKLQPHRKFKPFRTEPLSLFLLTPKNSKLNKRSDVHKITDPHAMPLLHHHVPLSRPSTPLTPSSAHRFSLQMAQAALARVGVATITTNTNISFRVQVHRLLPPSVIIIIINKGQTRFCGLLL